MSNWSPLQRTLVRYSGPIAMYFTNGKIKAKYNIKDERKELMECVKVWTDALKGKFLHGDKISMPDIGKC